MTRKVNLSGKTFHYLTVLTEVPHKIYSSGYKVVQWKCKCICGKIRYVTSGNLLSGSIKSCGCMNFSSELHPNQKFTPEIAAYRAKVANYKAHAKRDGRTWELTLKEAINLFKGNCYYCGLPPSNTYNLLRNRRSPKHILRGVTQKKHINILYSGIDRIDSSKGYVRNNCVSCCTTCNTAKMNLSITEFYKWIDRIIRYRRNHAFNIIK